MSRISFSYPTIGEPIKTLLAKLGNLDKPAYLYYLKCVMTSQTRSSSFKFQKMKENVDVVNLLPAFDASSHFIESQNKIVHWSAEKNCII